MVVESAAVAGEPPPARQRSWLVAVGAWVVGALVFFRDPIFSGFDTITGDRGDLRLAVFLNEHWWRVWHGDVPWRSPPMFHPVEGVLGYSDTFGLYQVVYVPLRALGIEQFAAFQLTLIALTFVGFVTMFAILRRHLALGLGPACLLAGAAAFSNNLYVDTGHPQMYAVELVPAAVLLALESWRATLARRRIVLGGAGGLLVGLQLWSTFYVGWFTLVLGSATVAIGVAIGAAAGRWSEMVDSVRLRWTGLAGWAAGFALGIVPFGATYLPVLSDTPSRSYDDVVAFAPRPLDIVNVGRHNVLWGRLVDPLLGGAERLDQLHRADAVTPVLLAGAVIAGIALATGWRRRHTMSPATAIGISLAVVAAVTVLIPIQFGFGGAWAWLHRFVPGGDAIRVYGRIEVVNTWVAVAAVACWWSVHRPGEQGAASGEQGAASGEQEEQAPPSGEHGAASGRRAASSSRRLLPLVVVVLIAVEQVNTTTGFRRLDRSDEVAALAAVPAPPAWCDWFAVVDRNRAGKEVYASIDAMLIAQRVGVPTVNGYSGQHPPGWLLSPWSATYLDDVDAWAAASGIDTPGCLYDLAGRTWSRRVSEPAG